ncbi:MAG: hypothetical protein IQL11_13590 [Bacteroidales bacterium]|nr:hypothetical protein [Bacteroidales bacterium]
MSEYLRKILYLISFTAVGVTISSAQDRPSISPYFQLQYFKNTKDQAYLQTTLTYSLNRIELPLPGMVISFYTGEKRDLPLGTVMTDEDGIAKLPLDGKVRLPFGADGQWTFNSVFDGNDTIDQVAADISVVNMDLEITLSKVDSIKKIELKASSQINGKKVPVIGEVVIIYVTRMFSLLPVGEITFDDNGTGTIDFPSDLPGDENGNITILAKIEENPTYGNIEKRVTERWGLPTSYTVPETHRALWTKTPPMWMIITLSILLSGVWGHYIFAIISLILIRTDAKRKKVNDEYKIKV